MWQLVRSTPLQLPDALIFINDVGQCTHRNLRGSTLTQPQLKNKGTNSLDYPVPREPSYSTIWRREQRGLSFYSSSINSSISIRKGDNVALESIRISTLPQLTLCLFACV